MVLKRMARGISTWLTVIISVWLTGSRCTRTPETKASAQPRASNDEVCRIAEATRPLPTIVRETSGLARGIQNPNVLWTHNDSGGYAELFALGLDGREQARVSIKGARAADWEDLAGGSCGNAACLYIADTGDNAGERARITVYEINEPTLSQREQPVQRTMHARYPDGPQDAEALFRLPSGELYIVTKGRQKAIKLYRLDPVSDTATAVLQLVREIAPKPASPMDWVTAATASPNGRWVAIRSYSTLYLYRTDDLMKGNLSPLSFALTGLGEKQGESLALGDDGTVWLSSEAENMAEVPTFAKLSCSLQ